MSSTGSQAGLSPAEKGKAESIPEQPKQPNRRPYGVAPRLADGALRADPPTSELWLDLLMILVMALYFFRWPLIFLVVGWWFEG